MTPIEFRRLVVELVERHRDSAPDLDTYLRSLWALVLASRDEPVTLELFAGLFERAFSEPPAPFDPAWMHYTAPPQAPTDPRDAFQTLTETLRFQIADLRRMKRDLEDDPWELLGTESPTGHSWQNLDPCTYLESGTTLFDEPAADGSETGEAPLDWVELAAILEWGRFYE